MTSISASARLVAGIFLITVANGQIQMAPSLSPPRPPIAQTQRLSAPATAHRAPVPSKNNGGLTHEDLRQLSEIMKRLTPKERKQLTKAIKQLTPDGRKRLVESLQRQPASNAMTSQVTKPREAIVPPLPPRLAF